MKDSKNIYRTGLFTNAIIWFGVAISVSEIEAGVQIASAAPINSIWVPLILGHVVGGIMLFLVGLIGARLRVNAMESIKSTFGNIGSKFFASLNVLQLIAWVAVLNAQGALALLGLNLGIPFPAICFILAILVAIWVFIGLQRSSKITSVVMIVLTVLLILLSFKLLGFNAYNTLPVKNSLTFWNIFEISIAMPISWLPVISDYTKDAQKPVKATAVSAIAYTIASLWMYFIGVEVVGIGTTSISQAILIAGLGIPGVIIMVLSTVTTNFLATNSAGESAKAIFNSLDPKVTGVIVSILSALLAISGIMDHYINFLYLISSVFGPMAAVLLVSFYFGNDNNNVKDWYWNVFSWFVGFIVYQLTVSLDSIFLGPTLLAIISSAILTYIWIILKKRIDV
ncbi:MAG: cytosine permease [Methanobrevibacter sp.]|uniref:cytosine permease n=1 Tax=Methanobrevibacter sp. TaxID=66852 RepID=UPI0025CE707F|nr:cytosine permease [Methanobrevibacter sp.]MBQ8018443.1 cytosine permease [Methanobrevibacter sp.]